VPSAQFYRDQLRLAVLEGREHVVPMLENQLREAERKELLAKESKERFYSSDELDETTPWKAMTNKTSRNLDLQTLKKEMESLNAGKLNIEPERRIVSRQEVERERLRLHEVHLAELQRENERLNQRLQDLVNRSTPVPRITEPGRDARALLDFPGPDVGVGQIVVRNDAWPDFEFVPPAIQWHSGPCDASTPETCSQCRAARARRLKVPVAPEPPKPAQSLIGKITDGIRRRIKA